VTTLVIIAKECLPGKVKTRLHPDVTFEQAAELAAAALADTLATGLELEATRRILLFDGTTPPAGAERYEVVPQVSGDLDERLAAIFDALDGPTVLVGMDTPQLRTGDLESLFPWTDAADFAFGPACDGGFWTLGMREPRGDLIRGVPMSQRVTGRHQLARLSRVGGVIRMLRPLTDIDTIVEAREVAAQAPETAFARTLAEIESLQVETPEPAFSGFQFIGAGW
jgi:glycosyltransferase A (GT-A) superfamily protein (DUF2064 family)